MQILSKWNFVAVRIIANRKIIRKYPNMKNIITAAQDMQPFSEQCTELGSERI